MAGDPVHISQQPAADVDAVGAQLDRAFADIKAALLDDRPVVITVDDRDLLGQRDPCDAAVAAALLGMARSLALEGAKPGWQVNVVTHRDGEGPVQQARDALCSVEGLTGQLVRVGTAHLGKVPV